MTNEKVRHSGSVPDVAVTHVVAGIPVWYSGNVVMEQGIEYTQSAAPYHLNSSYNRARTAINVSGYVTQIKEEQFHVGGIWDVYDD